LTASTVQLASLSNTGSVVRKGTAVTTLISAKTGAAVPATDLKYTFKAVLQSAPAASAKTNADVTLALAASSKMVTAGGGNSILAGAAVAGTTGGGAAAIAVAPQEAAGGVFTINTTGAMVQTAFTPDVAGTYKIYVWTDQNANDLRDAAEPTTTVTIVAGDIPTSFTLKTINSASVVAPAANPLLANNHGSLTTLLMKDAAGNLTTLAAGEAIAVSSSNATSTVSLNGGGYSSAGATVNLTSSTTPNAAGLITVNVRDTAEGSTIMTYAPTGSISTIAAQTTSLTYATTNEDADDGAVTISNTTGFSTKTAAAAVIASSTATNASSLASSVTLKYTQTTTAASKVVPYTVIDTFAANTSVLSAKYTGYIAPSAGTASVTIKYAATAGATTTIAIVADTDAKSKGFVITAADPSFSSAQGTLTPANISAVAAGTVTVKAAVVDQFGNAMVGQVAAFSVSGRNTSTTTTNVLTDANGNASFTYTDAGTTGNDTVSYTVGGTSATGTATVTFSATNAVSTVKVTSGDTTAGVADLSVDFKDIAAGTSGPSAVTQAVSATVANAAAAGLGGVTVTWTVAGTGCAIPSTNATSFTDATGVATSAVYAWLAGKCTITATAGAVTGTGITSFRQQDTTEIRTLTGSVAGTVVTASPKDRFGNPVVGGTIYAVITAGNGYFGLNGTRVTNANTTADGTVSFVVAGGDATVKLTTIDPAGTGLATDQSTAAAGYVRGDVATPVVFTATTVGTAITAETGVGASFAPAGVSSVTVEVTGDNSAAAAADAAAEATDAANAATDAANAAAEAADAATAAAQDAADAVAALSTQVSEMVNALKKQITALTNLVIKIQKKVRA
jgi:hypothetical protein